MTPARGRVLLRRVESGESYPGGNIIIPEPVRDALMAQHAEVVAVGEPALCENFDTCPRPAEVHGSVPDLTNPTNARATHPTDLRPGEWVLVAKRAGVECGDETGKEFLALQDDILAVFQTDANDS